jgi:hypothetical protein
VPVGGEVLAFHVAGHGPFAFDAGGGVKDAVAAHAAIDAVERFHQPFAAGGAAGVEEVALVVGVGGEFGEHDAAFVVVDTGAENTGQGRAGVVDEFGAVAGGVGELEAGLAAEILLLAVERAVMQEDHHLVGVVACSPKIGPVEMGVSG